jgi:hypothetical protein
MHLDQSDYASNSYPYDSNSNTSSNNYPNSNSNYNSNYNNYYSSAYSRDLVLYCAGETLLVTIDSRDSYCNLRINPDVDWQVSLNLTQSNQSITTTAVWTNQTYLATFVVNASDIYSAVATANQVMAMNSPKVVEIVEAGMMQVSLRIACLVLSCLVLSCLVLSCLVLSCLVLSCLVY